MPDLSLNKLKVAFRADCISWEFFEDEKLRKHPRFHSVVHVGIGFVVTNDSIRRQFFPMMDKELFLVSDETVKKVMDFLSGTD